MSLVIFLRDLSFKGMDGWPQGKGKNNSIQSDDSSSNLFAFKMTKSSVLKKYAFKLTVSGNSTGKIFCMMHTMLFVTGSSLFSVMVIIWLSVKFTDKSYLHSIHFYDSVIFMILSVEQGHGVLSSFHCSISELHISNENIFYSRITLKRLCSILSVL